MSSNDLTLNSYYAGIVTMPEPTISSLELVKQINQIRMDEDPTAAQLRHDNFCTKIRKELGKDAVNFKAIYTDSMNRTKQCYSLPEREASLMLMSESRVIRARIYDEYIAMRTENKRLLTVIESHSHSLAAKEPRFKPWKDDDTERLGMLVHELASSGITDPEIYSAIGRTVPSADYLLRIQQEQEQLALLNKQQPKKRKPRK